MKLEIKEPCHEDWNKMKIGVISRHCDVCEKSVMDFTKMNRAEIITYILSNPNDQVCGRLNRDQFDFHHEDIPILIQTLKMTKPSNSFLILALVCLSLTACAQESPTGNIVTPPPIEHTLGEIAMPPDTIPKKPTDTSFVQKTKGKVICTPDIEVGDIDVQIQGEIEPAVAGGIGLVPTDPPELPEGEKKNVLQFAEKMPEYPGGMEALFDFINKNLDYPAYEKSKNIEGNVYVRFTVLENGKIINPEILRSVGGSKNFDPEVLRVIGLMKKWNPGENNGKKVPVYMTLPFSFKLVD